MGLKNEFETAVVNEPSVFEPLKFYLSLKYTSVVRSTLSSNSRLASAYKNFTVILTHNTVVYILSIV